MPIIAIAKAEFVAAILLVLARLLGFGADAVEMLGVLLLCGVAALNGLAVLAVARLWPGRATAGLVLAMLGGLALLFLASFGFWNELVLGKPTSLFGIMETIGLMSQVLGGLVWTAGLGLLAGWTLVAFSLWLRSPRPA